MPVLLPRAVGLMARESVSCTPFRQHATSHHFLAFFMRKGADCLSKWVGEAERQLRLLFEEVRDCQPSVIFFDEIDGLAPVRSSKQDQIHASIVSTLLALMDGMDGRGQVIVIGATHRPDAIDPALRRPGRFDREFYFPLPSLEARERILTIVKTNLALLELVPSSARSSSSSASPLPTQLVPLLSDTLEKVKDAINRVLPVSKKRTALEEAMWEDDSEANALDRELFIQCECWLLADRYSR